MTKQARQRLGATAAAVGIAVAAVAAAVLPLAGTAAAATHDRHASMQTEVMIKAQAGQLVLARHDVAWVGGHLVTAVSGHPVGDGFYAQIPVTAVASLRHAPGIATVTVVGSAINE